MVLAGRCLCGVNAIVVDGPISGISLCHCSMCRRASGAGSLGHVLALAEDVRWTEKGPHRHVQLASGYGRPFCGECGSPLPETVHNGAYCRIPVGLLEDHADLHVTEHIFVGSAACWMPDQAPRYDGDGPARTDLPPKQ